MRREDLIWQFVVRDYKDERVTMKFDIPPKWYGGRILKSEQIARPRVQGDSGDIGLKEWRIKVTILFDDGQVLGVEDLESMMLADEIRLEHSEVEEVPVEVELPAAAASSSGSSSSKRRGEDVSSAQHKSVKAPRSSKATERDEFEAAKKTRGAQALEEFPEPDKCAVELALQGKAKSMPQKVAAMVAFLVFSLFNLFGKRAPFKGSMYNGMLLALDKEALGLHATFAHWKGQWEVKFKSNKPWSRACMAFLATCGECVDCLVLLAVLREPDVAQKLEAGDLQGLLSELNKFESGERDLPALVEGRSFLRVGRSQFMNWGAWHAVLLRLALGTGVPESLSNDNFAKHIYGKEGGGWLYGFAQHFVPLMAMRAYERWGLLETPLTVSCGGPGTLCWLLNLPKAPRKPSKSEEQRCEQGLQQLREQDWEVLVTAAVGAPRDARCTQTNSEHMPASSVQVSRWVAKHEADADLAAEVLRWGARHMRDSNLENFCCESGRMVKLFRGEGDADRYNDLVASVDTSTLHVF